MIPQCLRGFSPLPQRRRRLVGIDHLGPADLASLPRVAYAYPHKSVKRP